MRTLLLLTLLVVVLTAIEIEATGTEIDKRVPIASVQHVVEDRACRKSGRSCRRSSQCCKRKNGKKGKCKRKRIGFVVKRTGRCKR